MGGFVLYDREHNFQRTLSEDDLEELDRRKMVDWPRITEKEIWNRSKADVLSKGFAVLQTVWFIIQCISRGAANLPITELEIVTLAFSTLNVITYWLWWDKPFDARCPVHVYLKTHHDLKDDRHESNKASLQAASSKGQDLKEEEIKNISRATVTEDVNSERATKQALYPPIPDSNIEPSESDITLSFTMNDHSLQPAFVPLASAGCLSPANRRAISQPALSHEECNPTFAERREEMGLTVSLLYTFIWIPLKTAFTPLSKMFSSDSIPEHDRSHVPTFFCPADYDGEAYAYFVMIGITLVFGAIHCIPWVFKFPTFSEMWLWRLSSFTITAAPFLVPFTMMLSGVLIASEELIPAIVNIFVMLVGFSLVLGYIVSRILLLVLPLALLRDLPTSALVELRWSQVLPHI